METEDVNCDSGECIVGGFARAVALVADGEGVVDPQVLLALPIAFCILFVRSFSCWTACFRPRLVKGRLARPMSCVCCETSASGAKLVTDGDNDNQKY
jgi:hypothetical protein